MTAPLATHLAIPIAERQQCTAILASPTPALKFSPRSWNDHDQVLVDLTLWQGGQGMRIMTVAFALGTALVLCNLGTFSVTADARDAKVVREPRVRLIVRVPVERPYWDSYIVPRYRYRPEDDRVDPCGGPVVPVIRFGPQEETVPLYLANALGLGRVHGRDWPCKGQNR
jgi:hypothetical protein